MRDGRSAGQTPVTVLETQTMNILQVIPELDAGGAERTTVEVAEAVIAAGGQCLVASLGGRLEADLERVGARLIRLDMKTKNPISIWANAGRLAQIAKAEGIELIHARSRAPAWSAKWAAHRLNLPFVTTYHGTYNARSSLKRRYNAVMAAGDRVIANSNFIAEHVRAEHGVGAERLRVIPRGVDLSRFAPEAVTPERIEALKTQWGCQEGEITIVLPARLTEWKGQAFFIDVLAALGRDHKALEQPIRLVCLGDAQGRVAYVERLKARAAETGVELVLPGHASDMPAAYLAADLVVCPSLDPEAFGRTAAEAQAMGARVIAADHGGAQEVIAPGQTGWLAAPGDETAWGQATQTALALPAKALQTLGLKARARVTEQFSTAALQKATLQVYRELLE